MLMQNVLSLYMCVVSAYLGRLQLLTPNASSKMASNVGIAVIFVKSALSHQLLDHLALIQSTIVCNSAQTNAMIYITAFQDLKACFSHQMTKVILTEEFLLVIKNTSTFFHLVNLTMVVLVSSLVYHYVRVMDLNPSLLINIT